MLFVSPSATWLIAAISTEPPPKTNIPILKWCFELGSGGGRLQFRGDLAAAQLMRA